MTGFFFDRFACSFFKFLTPCLEVAAELIISMVQTYLNEADKTFDNKDFQPLFTWVDTAQKYNNSIHALTRNDNISVDQDMQKLTKQPVKDYCYYCGKTGHHFKNQNRVWTCPDRLAHGKQTFVPSLH